MKTLNTFLENKFLIKKNIDKELHESSLTFEMFLCWYWGYDIDNNNINDVKNGGELSVSYKNYELSDIKDKKFKNEKDFINFCLDNAKAIIDDITVKKTKYNNEASFFINGYEFIWDCMDNPKQKLKKYL